MFHCFAGQTNLCSSGCASPEALRLAIHLSTGWDQTLLQKVNELPPRACDQINWLCVVYLKAIDEFPEASATVQTQEAQMGFMALLSRITGLIEIVGFCWCLGTCTWWGWRWVSSSVCPRTSGLAETSQEALPLPSTTQVTWVAWFPRCPDTKE